MHELRFIKHARSLGFPIKQVDELLGLWRDNKRSAARFACWLSVTAMRSRIACMPTKRLLTC